MKLTKKIFINGRVIAKTGLHIGSKDLGLSIGNTDNTVLRDPVTRRPYIPGSSLRGKMRSLLERSVGRFTPMPGSPIDHGPLTDDPDHIICKVFGVPAKETKEEVKEKKVEPLPTSRLIVRDGHLTEDGLDRLQKAKNTDMPFTEVKTEVVIDRITSVANPRQIERVPAGAEFDLKMVLNIWEGDKEKDMLDLLFRGLSLLQDDYLGGHGSRGSGQIEVIVYAPLEEKTIDDYEKDVAAKPRASDKISSALKTEPKPKPHKEAAGASH